MDLQIIENKNYFSRVKNVHRDYSFLYVLYNMIDGSMRTLRVLLFRNEIFQPKINILASNFSFIVFKKKKSKIIYFF